MKKLAEREAERRAFLESLKPQLVEILDAVGTDGAPIDYAELRADVAADIAEHRAKRRRPEPQPA